MRSDEIHRLRAEIERLHGVGSQEWAVAHQALGVESGRKPRYPVLCEECGNYADPPSRLCPGCEAYQAHTHG